MFGSGCGGGRRFPSEDVVLLESESAVNCAVQMNCPKCAKGFLEARPDMEAGFMCDKCGHVELPHITTDFSHLFLG